MTLTRTTTAAQHVANRKKHTADVNKHLRHRLSDLWSSRHRGGTFITDTVEGHLMLQLLLRLRTTADSAMQSAPWLTEPEVKVLRKAGHKLPWDEIGELLKLMPAERVTHKLWCFRPAGVSWNEVRREQSRRNRLKDLQRRRKVRAKDLELREMLSNNINRKGAILAMLAGEDAPPPRRRLYEPPSPRPPRGDGWTAVPALVKRAQTIRAFRRPDGYAVAPGGSLRKAVHRAIEQLEDEGEIEVRTGWGVRGQVTFARLMTPHPVKNSDAATVEKARHPVKIRHGGSVSDIAEGENVGLTTASAENPAPEGLSRSVKKRRPDTHEAPSEAVTPPASDTTVTHERRVAGKEGRLSEDELDARLDQAPPSETRH